MFNGRRLLIVTKHQKEKVIAPLLEKELGVKCMVTENFDTDVLGTFTGEIERVHDPVTTARNKCHMAMELSDCDLAIASEGSFGLHPALYFIHADEEILLLVDKKNDLEIIVRELSTETNYNGEEIKTEKELIDFAKRVKFPSHALIIRKAKEDSNLITKGITDWDQLKNIFNQLLNKYGIVYIETDMRAMYNPTRMSVIEKGVRKLIYKIRSICPQCNTPGFGITNATQGLLCKLCGFPTRSTFSYIYTCNKCSFTREELYPHKKLKEDPSYCDNCNP